MTSADIHILLPFKHGNPYPHFQYLPYLCIPITSLTKSSNYFLLTKSSNEDLGFGLLLVALCSDFYLYNMIGLDKEDHAGGPD